MPPGEWEPRFTSSDAVVSSGATRYAQVHLIQIGRRSAGRVAERCEDLERVGAGLALRSDVANLREVNYFNGWSDAGRQFEWSHADDVESWEFDAIVVLSDYGYAQRESGGGDPRGIDGHSQSAVAQQHSLRRPTHRRPPHRSG